jgi:serine/threonine protein kinase
VIETASKIYLVLEYAKKGMISQYLPISEEKAAFYFNQLLSALEYMHENKLIVHRDIKPDNLLIDENDVLKI